MLKILLEEGFRNGILKGLEPSMCREISYGTARLGLYEPIKHVMGAVDPKNTPMWKKFTSGAIAGLIGSSFANPADLIKTRMQGAPIGENRSMGWHIKDVYKNEGGIKGFYRGCVPCMVRATLIGAAYMGTYDSSKHYLINHRIMEDGVKCQFLCTVVAGFSMSALSSPADNVKTRIMT
jgi:hypothetical protein